MALLQKADLEAKCVRPCLAKQIWKENVPNWVLPMSSQGPNQLCLRVGEMEACLGKIASGTNLTWKKLFTCPRRNFPGVLSRALWIKPPHTFSPPKFLGREDFVEPWPGKNVTPKRHLYTAAGAGWGLTRLSSCFLYYWVFYSLIYLKKNKKFNLLLPIFFFKIYFWMNYKKNDMFTKYIIYFFRIFLVNIEKYLKYIYEFVIIRNYFILIFVLSLVQKKVIFVLVINRCHLCP